MGVGSDRQGVCVSVCVGREGVFRMVIRCGSEKWMW